LEFTGCVQAALPTRAAPRNYIALNIGVLWLLASTPSTAGRKDMNVVDARFNINRFARTLCREKA
jgi:hypothetical protein